MAKDAEQMRLNYYTEVDNASFFDKFDAFMREKRTSRAIIPETLRDSCVLKLSINESLTYSKVTGGSSSKIIFGDGHARFIDNEEFLCLVALCVGCNIMHHE